MKQIGQRRKTLVLCSWLVLSRKAEEWENVQYDTESSSLLTDHLDSIEEPAV